MNITLLILFFSITALAFILWRNSAQVREDLKLLSHKFNHYLNPGRKEALLNQIICEYCKRGKGVYDPVYKMLEGKPHIAGTCNNCGKYIIAPLR